MEEFDIGDFELDEEIEIEDFELDVIKIEPIYEELIITPTTETQVKEGSFNKVTVEAIEDLSDELTEQENILTTQETTIEDIIEVLQEKAYDSLLLQEKEVTPTANEQEIVADNDFNGLSKVIINGDNNLKPENIKQGINIFGIDGIAKTSNAKITDASYLFNQEARLDYVNDFLSMCENVKDTQHMFDGCSNLTELDLSNFDTSNVTYMVYMFNGCSKLTELDLSNFDTSNVNSMQSVFANCVALQNINISNFDTSKVTNMQGMFSNCGITTIDLSSFNTSQVTSMSQLFNNCTQLNSLNISNFDASNVKVISTMFNKCNALTNLSFMTNLGKGYTQKYTNYSSYKLDLSYSTKLTHDSLISVINNLYDLNLTYDVAGGGTLYMQSLVLGTTNMAKLTAEEIAIATNKGWNVS